MKKNIYKLKGVDCANCGVKIENKLDKLNGVFSSNYVFMLERLEVTYDEEIISDDKIENTIVNTISGVKIISKKEGVVTECEVSKGKDKVKMILFRKRK